MIIDIVFRPPMRRWHRRLADELVAIGYQARLVSGVGKTSLPFGVRLALAVTQRVFGPQPSLFDAIPAPLCDSGDPADLVIVLGGAASGAENVLEPLFDGETGDGALLALLSRNGDAGIRVRARRKGSVEDLVAARPAIEDRDVLSRALDQVLARLITLLVQAVRRADRESPAAAPIEVSTTPAPSPLAVMARGVSRRVASRLPGAKLNPNHWRIGFRRGQRAGVGAGTAEHRAWPAEGFTILPGTADRFYADPMPFERDGRSFLFFEDYPYETGKGVIGLVEIAADGSGSAPRTVLEAACHLSYPFVLRHGDAIYMLPEMGASRRVQLFRADPFPERWVPDRILLDGIVASDATPVLHEGRWWMFATLSDDGGSTWDQLGLFHAPDLLGPWTPHSDNPVLVDASAARPAGAMWHEDGMLMRVAQDCRAGYGRGLAICRVERLDLTGYAQSVVGRLGPPEGTGADGVHTLGRAGTLEVIDLRYPRHRVARRAPARD